MGGQHAVDHGGDEAEVLLPHGATLEAHTARDADGGGMTVQRLCCGGPAQAQLASAKNYSATVAVATGCLYPHSIKQQVAWHSGLFHLCSHSNVYLLLSTRFACY